MQRNFNPITLTEGSAVALRRAYEKVEENTQILLNDRLDDRGDRKRRKLSLWIPPSPSSAPSSAGAVTPTVEDGTNMQVVRFLQMMG